MYREPAVRSPSETPPRELLYTPTDPDRVRGALPLIQLGAVPLFVGAVLSAFATPQVAVAGMVASGGLGVWWWRRSPGTTVLLRVEGGELIVSKQKPKREVGRFRLGELSDVELDTKTIRRVMDGASPIPAVRFTDSRVGPEVDTARIVLVREDGARLPLSDVYSAKIDATEWFGKVRRFLREHGWVPDDEREPVPEDEEDA